MRVTVLEGQTDITKESLGDLETLLETAMRDYKDADVAENYARSRTTAALNRVREI